MQHYTHLTCVHLQLHAQNMYTVRHYKKLRVNYCTHAIFLPHAPNYKHWSWKRHELHVLGMRGVAAVHASSTVSGRGREHVN